MANSHHLHRWLVSCFDAVVAGFKISFWPNYGIYLVGRIQFRN